MIPSSAPTLAPALRPRLSRAMEACVKLGTLAYWAPLLVLDGLKVWRSSGDPDALLAGFWTIYRQSLVFLAVWAAAAAVQAVLLLGVRGAPEREPPPIAPEIKPLPTRPRRPA